MLKQIEGSRAVAEGVAQARPQHAARIRRPGQRGGSPVDTG